MKVYVCGPMTGYVDHNYPAFHRAADHLRALGHEVVNPAELDESMNTDGWSHAQYLRRDLKLLLECDVIYPLPGANYSRGARLELDVAAGAGIFEIHDPDDELWRTFEGEPEESREDSREPACSHVATREHGWGSRA